MLKLIVEPYDPFVKRGLVLKQNLKVNWIQLFSIAAVITITAFALMTDPIALIFIAIPLFVIIERSIEYEIYGSKGQQLFYRERIGLSSGGGRWWNEPLAKRSPVYREKVLEYIEFLRSGGAESEVIEHQLTEWKETIIEDERRTELKVQQDTADMFNLEEDLKQYKIWRGLDAN